MRISIWQQFSSNHSSFFWIAGTFESPRAAREAYTELRQMLLEIDRWHQQHPGEAWRAMQAGNTDPLPPEQQYAQRYGVEWPMSIDWTGWADYSDADDQVTAERKAQGAVLLIDEAIEVVGRAILMTNPDQTGMSVQPFQAILERLGATVLGIDLYRLEAREEPNPQLVLSFTAPDDETADQLEQALRTYLLGTLGSPQNPPPWENDAENFERVYATSELLQREVVEIFAQNWQRRYDGYKGLPQLALQAQTMLHQRLATSSPFLVEREGLRFILRNIWFHNQGLGASALIAYLIVGGCAEIDFYYEEGPSEEGE